MERVLDLINEISGILGEQINIMYLSDDLKEDGGHLFRGQTVLIVRKKEYLSQLQELAEHGKGEIRALSDERTLH